MVSGFITQRIHTQQTVGEYLRYHREEQRLSIEQIAHDVKVVPRYIHFLEENQYDKLPAKVYVVGFVKLYAERLGLDEKRAVRLFNREHGIKENVAKLNDPADQKAKFEKVNFSFFHPYVIRLALIIGIVGFAVTYLGLQFSNFTSKPEFEILSPNTGITTSDSSITIEGVTKKVASITINGQAVPTSDNHFNETVPLAGGNNKFEIEAVDKFGNVETFSLTAVRSSTSDATLPSTTASDNKQQIELAVSVADSARMLITSEGKTIFSGLLSNNEVQTVRGTEITVKSWNAPDTLISVNGKENTPLGNDLITEKTFSASSTIATRI